MTTYRWREGDWTMIGKGDPRWPHAFYTIVRDEMIRITKGDTITGTCRYYNNEKNRVRAGSERTDEMCNIYLMWRVKYQPEPMKLNSCWGWHVRISIILHFSIIFVLKKIRL